MSIDISRALLFDKHAGTVVEGRLVDGITDTHLEDIETTWMAALHEGLKRLKAAGIPRSEWPQSRHWSWRDKVEHVRGLLAYRGFVIEYEERAQGLMLIKTTELCRLPEQRGKPLVYVDYLETAPWNQRALVDRPRFGGIGTVMLAAAITVSQQESFKGRIGLHSLPQSEEFYKTCGMTDLGHDRAKEDLRYFEMNPKQAAAYLLK
jgi:hypothetical protein